MRHGARVTVWARRLQCSGWAARVRRTEPVRHGNPESASHEVTEREGVRHALVSGRGAGALSPGADTAGDGQPGWAGATVVEPAGDEHRSLAHLHGDPPDERRRRDDRAAAG